MRLGYDKLDLLGVIYDAELELRAMYDLAKETAEYWKNNCTNDDFYKNCLQTISDRLGEDAYPGEVEEVWELIEENFLE